jgi:hypothetical protein
LGEGGDLRPIGGTVEGKQAKVAIKWAATTPAPARHHRPHAHADWLSDGALKDPLPDPIADARAS